MAKSFCNILNCNSCCYIFNSPIFSDLKKVKCDTVGPGHSLLLSACPLLQARSHFFALPDLKQLLTRAVFSVAEQQRRLQMGKL
jgi:hypothetical protein